MAKEEELVKRYYTIGEVADMFGVSKSLIRFWETEFDILRPYKNSKGDRRFTQQNIEQLNMIFHLVKERGFTLNGAKEEIRQQKIREKEKKEIIGTLLHLRTLLEDLKQRLP